MTHQQGILWAQVQMQRNEGFIGRDNQGLIIVTFV